MSNSVKLLLSLLMLTLAFPAIPAAELPTGPVPGKYIVRFSEKADVNRLGQALAKGTGLQKVSRLEINSSLKGSRIWDRYYVFSAVNQSLSPADVVAALGKENVEHVEPDYYLEFFDWPADSLFSHQWYLHNTGQEYLGVVRVPGTFNDYVTLKSGTPEKDIRLTHQYDHSPSETTRVVVAIVDSGTDPTHPELQGRFWKNRDEIPGNGADDDHNGFVDDTLGYDVSGDELNIFDPEGDNDPTDSIGHGTHIAGIIAANADQHGVVGIAPWAEVMPVKIMPNATSAVGAAGIMYAVNAGAQVINISWGTPFESSILREAVTFAQDNGVLVCIAPGNTGDNTRYFPAAFDSVKTLVVAAGNSDGYQTDFSTYGPHIDLVAPGLDILSLRAAGTDMYADPRTREPLIRIIGEDSLYYLSDGTSMATPMVVGAAAMILSYRPELSLPELKELILFGATDLVDPRNTGDTLIGPDTISGYGYLNIDSSLFILDHGALYITEPLHRSRHTEDFDIKIAPVAGYAGSWRLEYSVGQGSQNWLLLASGPSVPADSVIYTFSDPAIEGFVNFRVLDKFDPSPSDTSTRSQVVTVVHTRQNRTEISSPAPGQELDYAIPIRGSAYGPDFDSMAIHVWQPGDSYRHLYSSTGEFFDSLIFNWSVSGSDTGRFVLFLYGYFSSAVKLDTVSVRVKSAFANGWPRSIGGRGGMTAICCNLNRDDTMEIAVGTRNGLLLFKGNDGTTVPGFPVLEGFDVRCVPAVYDVDADGDDEIICSDSAGLHAFNYDGSYAQGWPASIYTGMIPYEYAFPNPVVAPLRSGGSAGGLPDSGIILIDKIGTVRALRFSGDSYFYSLPGALFARLDPRLSDSYGIGGGTSPFVTAADLTGDGLFEVVASYTSPYPGTGVGIFQGANGEPRFGEDPVVQRMWTVYGSVLADLNGDLLPEIISAGYDTTGIPQIWVKTQGNMDLPGWPVSMASVTAWIASYPTAADLDRDGVPEILCTFFEYDISGLYIFRADGTPYVERPGRPVGEAFSATVTFGTPVVANLTGDDFPEIVVRSGHLLPGTGPEKVYILDNEAQPLPGWPIATPARSARVFSSRFAPLIDDVDSDGLVELVLISDADELLVWNFDASVEDGRNTGRFLMNNHNTNILPPRVPTGVDDDGPLLPASIVLHQNYPNPFNLATVIRFDLTVRADVNLDIYNVLGQKVATLVDCTMPAGRHRAEFDGSGLATGVYFYRLKAGDAVHTKKMLLLK